MRKVSFLLVVAVLTASNVGCGGKIRSWFHRGSPCGTTTVAPAVLGAPLAMSAPIAAPTASAPMVAAPGYCQSAPICVTPCVPCDDGCGNCCENPCGDCGGGWTTAGSSGYFGGYVAPEGDCSDCGSGQVYNGTSIERAPVYEGEIVEGGRYNDRDPEPLKEE